MKTLVAGMGETGSALSSVLSETYEVLEADLDQKPPAQKVGVVNICFPYSSKFIDQVIEYQALYNPEVTIIHSTVPIGTTRHIADAVHSPIMGRHPDLRESLLAFHKGLAGRCSHCVKVASEFLQEAGIRVRVLSRPENTEAAKLLSTLRLGLDVMFQKQVYEFCDRKGLSFEQVYTMWTEMYNEGYQEMGFPHFIRPLLWYKEGPIGGHCVLPNAKILKQEFKPAKDLLKFAKTL